VITREGGNLPSKRQGIVARANSEETGANKKEGIGDSIQGGIALEKRSKSLKNQYYLSANVCGGEEGTSRESTAKESFYRASLAPIRVHRKGSPGSFQKESQAKVLCIRG